MRINTIQSDGQSRYKSSKRNSVLVSDLKQYKDLLVKSIKDISKEKKELENIYKIWANSQHKINTLETEIKKYKNISESCKQTYIDLSSEYNSLKKSIKKYKKEK